MMRPAADLHHVADRLAPGHEGAAQIDRHQPVEIRGRGLEQRLLEDDAGVVHEDVEAAEPR